MGERAGQCRPGAQHPVDLTQHTIEIGHPAELEGGQGDVDGVGADEGQLGEIALMQFDPDLMGLGEIAGGLDVGEVGVDPDDMCPLAGQGHDVVAVAGAEDEHPSAIGVAEEAQGALVGDVGAVGHDIGRDAGVGGEQGRRRMGIGSGF